MNLLIQFQRSGIWNTEFDITINGKITTQYLASVVADNLPPRPFSVRMVRVTPDSTTDRLQNKTLWYVVYGNHRYPAGLSWHSGCRSAGGCGTVRQPAGHA
ncbi:hypothetical protein LFZ31_10005 [Salmonella enterica subsp. enterica serovar Newport str. S09097]|nr:hypothetical protein LFZ31_10005 [Salmonella enterica subsp. enterica serovar Newport str. S09097]